MVRLANRTEKALNVTGMVKVINLVNEQLPSRVICPDWPEVQSTSFSQECPYENHAGGVLMPL
jgi:hypothetical protein